MVYVTESTLKHGFTDGEIQAAWANVFEYRRVRHAEQPPHYMALGTLPDGRAVELIAYSTGLDWVVFRAKTPPTAGFMHEYKTSGGKR